MDDLDYTEEKPTSRRKRSDNKKESNNIKIDQVECYPPGPITIYPSWNPTNREEKPPYSYATIIGHAILTSKERKLTLNDIYVWITKNYPFYSNDTQGWQNSIRHNLSLHKSFVKIDRDLSSQNPPRKGCFWTIRPGRERHFIDNLQRPVHSIKRHNSVSQFMTKRQVSRRHSSTSILYDPLRTTESEPSSDHLSSRSSSISSNYHEFIVPETYNVYPEPTELFSDHYSYPDRSPDPRLYSLLHKPSYHKHQPFLRFHQNNNTFLQPSYHYETENGSTFYIKEQDQQQQQQHQETEDHHFTSFQR